MADTTNNIDEAVNNQVGGEGKNPTDGWQVIEAILGDDEFAINDKGLYQVEVNENRIKPIMLVSAPLRIVADTRDMDNENWGRVLEFKDRDGHVQQHIMKMQEVRRDGEEVVDALLSKGLTIAPSKSARLRLVEYVMNSEPEENRRARSTEMTGWHQRQFVLCNEVLGDGKEEIIYQGRQPEPKAYDRKGSCQDWQENIGAYCVGNSRLVLAVASAFAAPLLRKMGMEGGGFHFVGNSSTGKSTALYVAASVMGNPEHYIQSWRATGNGLEGIAKFHNDTCLIIDEMGQVQAREAGEISYMLANGAGKVRANIKGDARQKATWRLLFLSSGEVTLAEHMTEGGRKARAGMEVRLVDIPADAGKEHGLFEDLHGYRNGADLSDTLKANSTRYHGTAFRDFLRQVLAEEGHVSSRIIQYQEDFDARAVPSGSLGQVRRAATRFGLIAAAGELATSYGLTGWKEGEAIEAAISCFNAWLDLRGGTGQQESKALLEQVRGFLEAYSDRFITVFMPDGGSGYKVVDTKQRVQKRAGFKINLLDGKAKFWVLPEGFKEMCAGFNIRSAAKTLVEKGVINPGNNGKSQKTVRLPEMGPRKVYEFNENIWSD